MSQAKSSGPPAGPIDLSGQKCSLAEAQILCANTMGVGTFGTLSWGIGDSIPATIVRPASSSWLLVWLWTGNQRWQTQHLPPSDRPRCVHLKNAYFLIGCQLSANYSSKFQIDCAPAHLLKTEPRGHESQLLGDALIRQLTPNGCPDRPSKSGASLALHIASSERIEKVATWAETFGWNERYLHRQLREAIGMRPVAILRLLRLRRILNAAAKNNDLAAVAITAGLTDQAQMNREVLDGTSLTPKQWLECTTDLLPPWTGCYGIEHSVDSCRLPTTKRRSKARSTTALSIS